VRHLTSKMNPHSLPVGRSAWSLRLITSNMVVDLGSRTADEEARAEVEVLNSRLEKTSQLSRKIQVSYSLRLGEDCMVGNAITPELLNFTSQNVSKTFG
jgi:hypothetical protein